MLRKCYGCRRWWGISAGEVSSQAKYRSGRDTSAGEGLLGWARRAGAYRRVRAYIRAGKLEAGSWKLQAGSWKGAKTMLVLGAGFALGGMVVGSFASLKVVAVCELIGWALMGVAKVRAEQKERETAQKLVTYPTYKY